MNLTQEPQLIQWTETHYIFIEKIGPFSTNAPQAWQAAHAFVPAIAQHNRITGYTSLYKPGPKIYRAGFQLAAEPINLPEGLQYEKFAGGKYLRFVLTGSYAQLGPATGRAFEIVAQKQIPLRDDFCIENYVTDPKSTPDAENITEILIPTT